MEQMELGMLSNRTAHVEVVYALNRVRDGQ